MLDKETKHDQEVKLIRKTITATGGNITESARTISIHRTGLHQKIKLYHLQSEVLSARKKQTIKTTFLSEDKVKLKG